MRDLLSTILRFAAVLLGCISVHGIHSADAQTVPTPSMADQLGRTVLTRQVDSTENGFVHHGTYYVYDIRDRLTQSSHRVFSENISYVDGTTGKGYNGNASSVSSTLRTYHPSGTSLVRQQGWQFRYDGLGRMKSALPMRMLSTERSSETIGEYDLNGNILSLVRQGRTARGTYGVIDSLSLSYSGNRLVAVSDSKGEAAQNGFEFAADSAAFSYDSAGRLTADSSRGIQSVSYYPTGDPEKIVFSDGSSTIYLYAADGTKLRSQHNSASGSRTLDFCGSLIYENLSPKWLLYDEGYRDLGTVSGGMRFFIKDRLGSIRSVVDSTGAVMGQYIYFPFGGPADAVSADDGIQPFRFSGKEWDSALSSLDFGRRTYLPAIARWSSPDPFADKYPGISPYAYCAGNPVNIVDPDGRYLETAFDVTSLVLGINSLRQNIRDGKIWASILDGAGVLADVVAAALPIVPGGASVAIAGVRAADDIIDAARTADNITDAAGAAADAVKAADDVMDVSKTATSYSDLPIQKHHFATDKHQYYTPEFNKIISKYGLDLNGSWNIAPLPHRGRHTHRYHEFVLRKTQQAADEAGDDVDLFLQKFNEYVIEPVSRNPEILRQ